MSQEWTATLAVDGSGDLVQRTPAIEGFIESIKFVDVDLDAGADIDIDEVGGAARKILNLDDTAPDTTYRPRQQVDDNTGEAVAAYERFYLAKRALDITVDEGGVSKSTVITITVDGHISPG